MMKNSLINKGKRLLVAVLITIWIPVGVAVAHGWMAPKEASKIQNNVPYGPESAARGKEIYLDNCAACHGDNLKGLSAEDAGLKKSSPDLPKRLSTHSDGDFFWKIQNGRGEMPSFKEDLEDKEIWDTINYIKDQTE